MINLTKLQIDSEAKAVFREEADDSYMRLSYFVALFIMLVAVIFQRAIKWYFLKVVVLGIGAHPDTHVGRVVPIINSFHNRTQTR